METVRRLLSWEATGYPSFCFKAQENFHCGVVELAHDQTHAQISSTRAPNYNHCGTRRKHQSQAESETFADPPLDSIARYRVAKPTGYGNSQPYVWRIGRPGSIKYKIIGLIPDAPTLDE
jgi:hypothetical protein